MNNTSDSNKRKKKILSGTASVKRRDDNPVGTSGPVGRKEGYQGRRTQYGGSKPGGTSGGFPFFGNSSQSQNSQNQSTQNQQPQQTYSSLNNASGTDGTGSSGNGLLGSGLGKIIVLVLIGVLIFLLVRCIFRSRCEISDVLPAQSGVTQDIGGNNLIPDSSVQQGYTSDFLSQLLGNDTFDVTDNNAPAAVSASTSYADADYTVSNRSRDRYTTIKGNGKDTVTLMIYLCGSDLESENSMATADLNEMLHAGLNDEKVNIIVETGGAKKWNNSVISNKTNQRYRITSRGLQVLDKDVGRKSMVDPNTLVDFIQFCAKNYPANRYMLILWDHGGGAISGYGYDQTASGTMTLDKLNTALKKGGVKFDFIGFDACLMGTLETAVVTEQYADYLIASEEAEPGTGWYYTNWLTALSKNPSIETVKLSKTLIDDFTDVSKKNYPGCNTTLSIVDLAEFAGTVPDAFNDFSGDIAKMLDDSEYKQVADARADAREFGVSSKVNHIDVVDFATRIGSKKANALANAVKGCVKYNRTSVSMKNSNGLSIYFPYSSFKSMNSAVALYSSIGISGEYSRCIKSFASLAAGGQIATGGQGSYSPYGSLFGGYSGGSSYSSGDILSTLLGGSGSGSDDLLSSLFGGAGQSSSASDFLGGLLGGDSYGWFDSGRVLANRDYYEDNSLTVSDLVLKEKGDGEWVVSMSKEKWDLVKTVQINLFVKDEETDAYLDLGMDDQYSFDSEGCLKIEFDNSWLTINGQAVAYYFLESVEDGKNWATAGRVPVLLNGERYDLIVVFDNETAGHEGGYVAGAQRVYDESETITVAKGFVQLQKGDRIDFLCDYYGADGTYSATYYLGNPITYNGKLTVGYMDIGDAECDVCYCLTDIYGNEFWTETLTFE